MAAGQVALGLPPDAPRDPAADAAIGLGSHDLGVAAFSAELYRAGLFPHLVFTGGNSPTTAKLFPRGEAVHFSEHAIELGVPDSAILLEPTPVTPARTSPSRAPSWPRRDHAEDGAAGLQALHGATFLRHRPQGVARGRGRLCVGATEFDDYLKTIGDDNLSSTCSWATSSG